MISVGTEHLNLSREQIIWAYRVLFDRDPENEKAIIDAGSYGSMARLRDAIITSNEFADRQNARPPVPKARMAGNPLPLEIETSADFSIITTLLERLSVVWGRLGEERPHWSVLSADEFGPDRIASNKTEFYQSGRLDLDWVLTTLSRSKLDPLKFSTVFEFGCGVGRVTPYLARQFRRVDACDVSLSHIRLAEAILQDANINNVKINHTTLPKFGMFQPFDLWISRIVLQHNPPPIIALILQRAFDLLNPGGVALFQIPTHAPGYGFDVVQYLSTAHTVQIEMHVMPQHEIFAIADRAGCVPLEVVEDDSIGIPGWISTVFAFLKRQ